MGRSSSFGFPRALSAALLLGFVLAATAHAETIDFEGIVTIAGPPFDVDSMGFTVQQVLTPGSPEPIIRPASLSPNGTDLYGICGFCGANAGFNLYKNDGSAFALISIDLGGFGGNTADEFDIALTGYALGGAVVTEELTVSVAGGMVTLALDASWQNLTSVTVDVDNTGNGGFSGSGYDNIVLGDAPFAVAIDVLPGDEANVVYSNRLGKVPVAILASAEFDATQVNPATLKFGIGEAAPSDAAVIADVDGAFGADTTVRFKVEETGIFCDDTSVTLSGETYAGDAIAGVGVVDASDCESGSCHVY